MTIIRICIEMGPGKSILGLAMYICICHAITDRQIREVVDRGAQSLCEVQQHLPVAACCGRCEQTACELIEEHVQATAQPVAA